MREAGPRRHRQAAPPPRRARGARGSRAALPAAQEGAARAAPVSGGSGAAAVGDAGKLRRERRYRRGRGSGSLGSCGGSGTERRGAGQAGTGLRESSPRAASAPEPVPLPLGAAGEDTAGPGPCGHGSGERPGHRARVVPLPRAATGNLEIATAYTSLVPVREIRELQLGLEIEDCIRTVWNLH